MAPDERTPLLSPFTSTSVRQRKPRGVLLRTAQITSCGLVLIVCALWARAAAGDDRAGGSRPSTPRRPLFSTPAAILAVGDWGRDGHAGQKSVAAVLARVASAERNVRIVSTGDNFYDNGVKSVADVQFNSSYEDIYNIYESLSSTPFWPVLGNHDHIGNALAQIAYSTRSPQWDMPARFYARSLHPSLLLVFLDTTPYLYSKEGAMARKKRFPLRAADQVVGGHSCQRPGVAFPCVWPSQHVLREHRRSSRQ